MFFSLWKVNNLHIRHHCLFVCECKNDQEGKGKPCQVGTEESYKTWVKNMHRSPSGWKEKTKCSGRRKRRQEATRYNRQRKKRGWSESVFKCAASVSQRFLQWIPAIVPTYLKPSIKLPLHFLSSEQKKTKHLLGNELRNTVLRAPFDTSIYTVRIYIINILTIF